MDYFQIGYYESWDFALEKGIKSLSPEEAITKENFVKVIVDKGNIQTVEFYKNIRNKNDNIVPELLEQQKYYYNELGQKAVEEVYKNNKLFVFYRYVYDDNNNRVKQEVFNHKRKLLKKWVTSYNSNNKPEKEECFENEIVSFTIKYHYDESCRKMYEEHIPADNRGGHLKIRYNSENVKIREEDYLNGVPDGSWRYFDNDGKMIREETYKNGSAEGFWQYYNVDGFPFRRELYEDGKLILSWQLEYDEYGNEIAGELFQNNKRIKKWKN